MTGIGLVVNPVAGLGGRVGLKGSDGAEIQAQALSLGAEPQAMRRASLALSVLKQHLPDLHLLTYPHDMGANSANRVNIPFELAGHLKSVKTTAEDTIEAARNMRSAEVDLILFCGGDGTARDIYQAIGSDFPVLGIPAGVKVHSGVFAATPQAAAALAGYYVHRRKKNLQLAEVLDIDEHAYRRGFLATRLYGHLSIPYHQRLVPGIKTPSFGSDETAMSAIAAEIVASMESGCCYILGPGTTTKAIMEKLGLSKTLLGVDVVQDGCLKAADVNESQLLGIAQDCICSIIVSPIGGQGFVLGRGNQQISPAVLKTIGVDMVRIVASPAKIFALQGKPLVVDTGDVQIDAEIAGLHKVITGAGERLVYPVVSILTFKET